MEEAEEELQEVLQGKETSKNTRELKFHLTTKQLISKCC